MALYDPSARAPKQVFKTLAYQDEAVEAVLSVFDGQPHQAGFRYTVDPGRVVAAQADMYERDGIRNEPIMLAAAKVLDNIQTIQTTGIARNMAITMDEALVDPMGHPWYPPERAVKKAKGPSYNIDVEMETGTGKTYVYLKTAFELNKRFGWSKFIVMVPSVAIREGVFNTIEDTSDHFHGLYGTRANAFIYNSKHLAKLEAFASNAGINIMVINTQAFAATGKDARRIYMELDDFNSRRPIDVIKETRPILILDEPQKMEGKKTVEGLSKFQPLFTLRYSATHKTEHNTVHRLDALDAYNERLVKKIAVRGITVKNLPGTSPFLHATRIDNPPSKPIRAFIHFQKQLKSGKIKRNGGWFVKGDDLYQRSGELEAYRGHTVRDIRKREDVIDFGQAEPLRLGEPQGDISEETLRRIQIRETIRAHLETERKLFAKGIKVLSLFFIDSVANYRVYEGEETRGLYARMFEEEYPIAVEEARTLYDDPAYTAYLARDVAGVIHQGYFAQDKKGRMKDPDEIARGDLKGESKDVGAYDLILKHKARLVSFEEPVRFIFSHSALAEGWDNPNVFQICTLKPVPSSERRVRQEVGRGLRICVDAHGDRMDSQRLGRDGVHDINRLTVVAGESYEDFVASFQKEVREALRDRPRVADEDFFMGKTIPIEGGEDVEIDDKMAKAIYRYLLKNDYTDDADHITPRYTSSKAAGELAELPESLQPYAEAVFKLIDSVQTGEDPYAIDNAADKRTNEVRSDNLAKVEFQTLWKSINRQSVYQVDFDSEELTKNCIRALDRDLHVAKLSYEVGLGEQRQDIRQTDIDQSTQFTNEARETQTPFAGAAPNPRKAPQRNERKGSRYDLIGQLSKACELTRRTVGSILTGISPKTFAMFGHNPEMFIAQSARIIRDEKGATIVARINYDLLGKQMKDGTIFAAQDLPQGYKNVVDAKKHVWDFVPVDSKGERGFVGDLETSTDVVVYAKLPTAFKIPTPVGDYSPDWAVAFREGSVKHVYFVAETKGSLSTLQLRGSEKAKIECARRFFDNLNAPDIRYDVVEDFDQLLNIVR
ncbi:MAG: type III restriction-modification system endonuclease [Litorimonas sp.]